LNATVQGNYLGTNAAGTAAVPDSGNGVVVSQADGAMIGGTAPGAGNVISGSSTGYGVAVREPMNAQIHGHRIGTAADGTTPLPNVSHGVWIYDQASHNVIGDPIANAGNTI